MDVKTKSYDIWIAKHAEGEIHGSIVGIHLESCIGCMKCVNACPTSVFTILREDMVVVPTNERDCIFCMICEMVCPTEAICVDKHVGSDDTLDSLLGNV